MKYFTGGVHLLLAYIYAYEIGEEPIVIKQTIHGIYAMSGNYQCIAAYITRKPVTLPELCSTACM